MDGVHHLLENVEIRNGWPQLNPLILFLPEAIQDTCSWIAAFGIEFDCAYRLSLVPIRFTLINHVFTRFESLTHPRLDWLALASGIRGCDPAVSLGVDLGDSLRLEGLTWPHCELSYLGVDLL